MQAYRSLDKIRMNVVKTDPNGVVNEDTIFIFSQTGDFISASYSGGKIRQGYLVGRMNDNRINFSYCQLQIDGKMDNGQSACDLSIGENGKLRLTEHFEWASREGVAGTNIFQEL